MIKKSRNHTLIFHSQNPKSTIQTRPRGRKWLGFSVVVFVLVATGAVAQAQQTKKIPRIGFLAASSLSSLATRTVAFREGLHELGYLEGKNIIIEWRSAEGKLDRLPELAAELVHIKVDVIVSSGPTSTHSAKKSTVTIPVVFAQDPDPIDSGFVASLARPGANITGLSNYNRELGGKRLQLLKEILPKASRVAVFGTSSQRDQAQELKETELAAKAFVVQLQYLDVLEPQEIETAFKEAKKGRADAVLLLGSPLFNSQRKQVVDLAVKNRLPAMYPQSDYMDAGGLMFYGANINDLYRRAATYVDKILKGRSPADLPVEQPMKFEFIINLKAAKQIGLTIPPNVLVRADRVIK